LPIVHSLLHAVTKRYTPLQRIPSCSVKARNLSQFGLNSHYGRSINENAPQGMNLGGVEVQMVAPIWKSGIEARSLYTPKPSEATTLAVSATQLIGRDGPVAQKPNPTGSDSWMTVKYRCRELSGSPKDWGLQTGSERPLTAYSARDRYSKTNRRMDVKHPGGRLIPDTDTVRIANKTWSAGCLDGRRVSGTGVFAS
jgi:hypothetical protein